MAVAGAAWVACTLSLTAAEAERIIEVLDLQPGERVADVGAGDGTWAAALARQVGPTGQVWATEVDEDELAKLRRRFAAPDGGNVTVVAGDQERIGLPAGCCDAVLLRLVYHHFTDPAAMRAELYRALVPGGRLAVVDIAPQEHWRRLEGVPERGGHGIDAEELVRELRQVGFTVVARHSRWQGDEDRYCIVFRR